MKKKVKYYDLPEERSQEPGTAASTRAQRRKQQKKRKFLKVGLLLIFVILLLAVVTGVDMADNSWLRDTLFGGKDGGGFPVGITGSEVSYRNFTLVGSKPAYVSDTQFVILNRKGAATTSLQNRYRTPVLAKSSRNFLIYDLGNKGYSICNTKEILTTKTISSQILCAAIGDNGTYAIASGASGFASQMTVYSKKYDAVSPEIYSWQSPNCRITALAVSPNGKEVVAAGLSGENGSLKTTLYVFDLTSAEPKMTYDLGDTIVLSLEYQSRKKVAVVGDHGSFLYDTTQKTLTGYPYEKEQLFGYHIDGKETLLLLAPSQSGEGSRLVVLDEKGAEKVKIPLNGTAIAAAKGKKSYYVLQGDTVVGYDRKGNQTVTVQVGADARNLLCYKNQLYVLGLQEIRNFSVKK